MERKVNEDAEITFSLLNVIEQFTFKMENNTSCYHFFKISSILTDFTHELGNIHGNFVTFCLFRNIIHDDAILKQENLPLLHIRRPDTLAAKRPNRRAWP